MRDLNIRSIQQSTYVKCFMSRGRICESIFFFFFFGSVASSSQEMKAFVFLSSWLKWSFILPLSFAGLWLDLVPVVFSAHPSPASRHPAGSYAIQGTVISAEPGHRGAHTLLPAVTPGPQRVRNGTSQLEGTFSFTKHSEKGRLREAKGHA